MKNVNDIVNRELMTNFKKYICENERKRSYLGIKSKEMWRGWTHIESLKIAEGSKT